jgi:hypothetical protein
MDMKRYFLAALVVALSVFSFGGCANQPATTTASNDANPSKTTYTREDLDKSGRAETGAALSQIDPDIQSRGR